MKDVQFSESRASVDKHWHGASATTSMTHLAIQEALDEKNVVWLEKVSDEEYFAGPPAA